MSPADRARPGTAKPAAQLGAGEITTARVPLHQAKADFFKALTHPVRIRVLELLAEREYAVSEMVPLIGVEATQLSQQLAVLRAVNLVTTRRDGTAVIYALVSPQVAELLTVARKILTEVLTRQVEVLEGFREGPRAGA